MNTAARARRNRRLALVGGVLAVAGLAVALVMTALGDAVAYFYTPSDLAELHKPPSGVIRLGGLVEQGSLRHEEGGVRFVVTDHGGARITVAYRGILPDLFREGQGVVVQGRLAKGEVAATEVLAKHDENYMPREVADALKKQGRWKEGEGAY